MSCDVIQVNQKALHHVMDKDVQDVPLGYKLTEVGIIPENWGVQFLRSCLCATPAYGINAPAVSYSHSLPTYLRITDISEDSRFRPSPKVSVKHPEACGFYLAVGDLVFARTGASVGKSYRYDPDDGPLVFAGFLIKITPNPTELSPAFLGYFVQSKRYWDWVSTVSVRSGQPGINGKEYGSLVLPIPPLGEQRAIAEALSDVDALLGALEALIAKKRAIKQAAMQQLLTGKTRLPGFRGEWEVKQLGNIAPLQRGFDLPTQEVRSGPYPVVYSNGILKHHAHFQANAPGVVTGRSGTIGRVTYVDEPYWPHNTTLWVTSFNENDPRFVFYLYTRINFQRFASGSGVPTLNRNDAHSYQVALPATKSEQTAIANVLSDMDSEIAALEARRDKTRAIKQGMTQQLLTGRIRLVEAQAA